MNSQNNRVAIFAALEFAVVTILSLIITWISSETEVAPVSYWLAVFFLALLITGAPIEWARKPEPRKPTASHPTPFGPMPPHQQTPPLRTTGSVIAGGVSGLLVSVLFFPMIGPGSHEPTTAPYPSPTVTIMSGSAPPTSGPAPTASSPTSSGQLVTVLAMPGDGGTQFGDDVTVIVTTGRPLAGRRTGDKPSSTGRWRAIVENPSAGRCLSLQCAAAFLMQLASSTSPCPNVSCEQPSSVASAARVGLNRQVRYL